ncbi:MAG: MarR family transcriptional regulator [Planctomycetota bacterium]|nr:MAG: MarR family transcriptional regulator [Planctomycetota bacterium]
MNKLASPRRPAARNGATVEPLPSLDVDVLDQARELDAALKALARKILIDDDPASELPLRQFRVCAALFEGPRTMKELSRQLGVSQSAVTQLADRLETAGMVTRAPADGDRRVRSLELTARARRLLKIREERRIERMGQILDRISRRERTAVVAAIAALKDAAAMDES